MTSVPVRIAVDTGGTFTDCVWFDPKTHEVRILKLPSTPSDPSQAIADAIRQIEGEGEVLLLHGTTVGTNAVLERRGARVVFITTKGFEDTLEIGRQARPKLYDFFFDKVQPLVASEDCIGVAERVGRDGNVIHAIDDGDLREVSDFARKRAQAIAISLLFSFSNPEHEEKLARVLAEIGVPMTVSHKLLPEFREYERASTVVMNAYLQPVTSTYLERLQKRVKGRVFLMQSNGGLASIERASAEPVRTVLSGPAGGVIGAAQVAKLSGDQQIIGFDMGGTSTDVWLIEDEPRTTSEAEVAGLPVRVPMLNIHTVGAGGGSLAWFDTGSALRVGPQSAGADPGPICYGKGDQPTVTDCNLVLGRLPHEVLLAGSKPLDLERTRTLTREWLRAQGQKLPLEAFAEGVIRVVNSNMEKAIRLVSIEKGYDPRRFTLVAFGGAGALHACELAEGLEIPRVLVPVMPGALSALGILMSDVLRDYSKTLLLPPSREIPLEDLEREAAKIRRTAEAELRSEGWKGRIDYKSRVDLRYAGQGYEISVPLDKNTLKSFETEHQRIYGFTFSKPVEVVTLRLSATITMDRPKLIAPKPSNAAARPASTAQVFFDGKLHRAQYIQRDSLRKAVGGPAILGEYSATTFVPPSWTARTDRTGNLILTQK